MAYPIVSVIVPVYNTAKYLCQCLNAICNQTFRDIEIICVNDGSTDQSGAILNAFAAEDARITVLHREQASGSAALPRNMGLDIARGKYVSILDSDDYFDHTMLEKMVKKAEAVHADLVMCDNYRVHPSGEMDTDFTELHPEYFPEQEVFSYKDIPETIFQISNATAWHKLILRETIEQHRLRFQEGVPILDDIYFANTILVLSQRISVVREHLVYYRVNRDNGQTTKIDRHKDSVFLAFYALNEYLKTQSLYDVVKTSLQNWTLKTMSWWMYSCASYAAFSELYTLYQDEYFKKLGLLNIEDKDLYDVPDGFYQSVLERNRFRSIKYALDSVLKPGSRIILYGAGFVGKKVYNDIKSGNVHTILLWCDSKADVMNNPLISLPDKLLECDCDAVFVAIGNLNVARKIKETLIDMGIAERKIYTT